ncbi:hypothetical protein DL93DRAFT_1781597 [Clavulina sp. PMI_390]|nr:hypothetical protein DL93DRAFT_1781597 [Clavulina sp. PMI_390]
MTTNMDDSTHENMTTTSGQPSPADAATNPPTTPQSKENGESSSTLQTTDVIELHAFLERKTWIDSQIDHLDALPHVNPFESSEKLATSSARIDGLPDREVVQQWIQEVDAIASETEQFDHGDMTRLKEFAKAKSEQNLSPQDTDLIELTLTTLLSLEKLMHIIRTRSEALDVLAQRLEWEEQRLQVWDMRSNILETLKSFGKQATWTTAIYDADRAIASSSSAMSSAVSLIISRPTTPSLGSSSGSLPTRTPSPSRPRSHTQTSLSQSPGSSQSPESIFPSVLSAPARAHRRKAHENINASLQSIFGQLRTFRKDIFPLPGLTLDKMIETSTKKLPDVLLDEQDKVEDETRDFSESLDKFLNALAAQWKKVDEYFAELKRDTATAQLLLSEINLAFSSPSPSLSESPSSSGTPSLALPSPTLAANFTSRTQALSSRLSAIGMPMTVVSRPRHPLFPLQGMQSEAMLKTLTDEYGRTLKAVKEAMDRAREYSKLASAVDKAGKLIQRANQVEGKLTALGTRIHDGVPSNPSASADGEEDEEVDSGVPPNLQDERCLNPSRHGAYMALLPSLFTEISECDAASKEISTSLRVVLIELQRSSSASPSITPFSASADAALSSLSSSLAAVQESKRQAIASVDALRRARGVWTKAGELKRRIAELKEEIGEAVEVQGWKPEATMGRDGLPLTPESARSLILEPHSSPAGEGDGIRSTNGAAVSPSGLSARDVKSRIQEIQEAFNAEVQLPLNALSALRSPSPSPSDSISSSLLGPLLLSHLGSSARDVASQLDALRALLGVLERVQKQADVMRAVTNEGHELDATVDRLRSRIQEIIDDTLRNPDWRPDQAASDPSSNSSVPSITPSSSPSREGALRTEVDQVRDAIGAFTDALSSRVPMVSLSSPDSQGHSRTSSRSPFGLISPDDTRPGQQESIHRKIAALDQVVRSDVNAIAMSLGSRSESLKRKLDLYSLAELARLMDTQLDVASKAIVSASTALSSLSTTADSMVESISELKPDDEIPDLDKDFSGILSALDVLVDEHTSIIGAASSTALATLRRMRSSPGARDSSVHDDILSHRSRSFELLESRAHGFQSETSALRTKIIENRRLAEAKLHEEKMRREREEMLRRGSITEAELEASRAALRESELKAKEAEEERKRLEEESKRKEEQARLDEIARLEEEQRLAAARAEEERRREEERLRLDQQREAEERRRADDAAKKSEAERAALEAAHKAQLEEAARAAEAAAAAAAAAREADVFNALEQQTPAEDPQVTAQLQEIAQCRSDLRSIGIDLAAQPEFESIEDAVSPLPTADEAREMRSQFDSIAVRAGLITNGTSDEKVKAELKSLKIELEASRVLLGHLDQLATFGRYVENCDNALSDLLEHADTFPDQPAETMSQHKHDSTKSPTDQLQDRLDFCEKEVDSLHGAFALVGHDERALGERARVTEMWDDVADSARLCIATARAKAEAAPSMVKQSATQAKPSTSTTSLRRPSTLARPSISRERSPVPSVISDTPRLPSTPSASSLRMKKPYITPDPGRTKLRPTRERSPSRSSVRSISGPFATGSSRQSSAGTYKLPATPSRPPSRTSARSVSGPTMGTPSSSSRFNTPTMASRQRTISSISNLRDGPSTPVALPRIRARISSNFTAGSIPRASSPTLSTVSNTSSPSTPAKIRPRLSSAVTPVTPRVRGRASMSDLNTATPRPKAIGSGLRQKRTYVANPKNRLDMAVGAVVNKLPADVTIEPVLDTWKDESGKYWIGDAEPKLCFCRILRSQTVMVRVGGGWMELSKFIRLHYSHLFRVDTLTTPPKAPSASKEERWISSASLQEQPLDADGNPSVRGSPGSGAGTWSPVNVLRMPMIPATPEQLVSVGSKRSPTPINFLRENSPGASSPLTPLHFIRRASVEPGLSPPVMPSALRERSPALSSDGGGGGGSVAGSAASGAPNRRPRVSANNSAANSSAPIRAPRWR